ncbi:MAG: extracellular solute-binding protein [Acidobacteriota bacterium]|nr:extracellular solute-binding protein [Acidobacteriota bacterium]
MIELTGITWNHTRGYLPMVATAQRFSELYPNVSIAWHKRSLQQFADASLVDLAARFDLVVIDHPSIGEASHLQLFLPLDQDFSAEFLADQAAHSVGQSHSSYHYNDHQYALAIDAAAPVSGYRTDLLQRAGVELPATWDDLLTLARRGLVTVPAIAIDTLMNLFMLANALGAEPFSQPEQVIAETAGITALQLLRELVQLCAPGSLDRNPILTWQLLADSATVAYCPFAYGYSNYSRPGYAASTLHFGGLVTFNGKPLRSTLGGAGLAISRTCKHPEQALVYAEFVASPCIQKTLYAQSGGQPGHRSAWLDPALNTMANDFFANTLPTLDSAWVRPRFPGFISFQDSASNLVHRYLVHGGSEAEVLHKMNEALAVSRKSHA